MNTSSAQSTSLVLLAMIAVGAVLYFLKPLLIPFLIAVMITYLISPLIERLKKFKIPRLVSLLMVFLIVFGLLGVLIRSLAVNATEFAQRLPEYQTQVQALVDETLQAYPWIQTSVQDITSFLFSLPLATYANAVLNSSLNFFSDALLVLLFVIYLCLSAHTYPDKIRRAFDASQGKRLLHIVIEINRGIRKYLSIHTLISIGVGISSGIIAWSFGVPFPLLWGFLAFVLNYIPTIGSIIAALPVILIALVQDGVGAAAGILFCIVGAQFVWESVIEAKLAGESLGLSPVVILLSLLFWGWLWGIVGAILAIPIAFMIKIVCEHVPSLRPVAVFMDDK